MEEMATVASMCRSLGETAQMLCEAGGDPIPEVVAEMGYIAYQVWDLLGEVEAAAVFKRSGRPDPSGAAVG